MGRKDTPPPLKPSPCWAAIVTYTPHGVQIKLIQLIYYYLTFPTLSIFYKWKYEKERGGSPPFNPPPNSASNPIHIVICNTKTHPHNISQKQHTPTSTWNEKRDTWNKKRNADVHRITLVYSDRQVTTYKRTKRTSSCYVAKIQKKKRKHTKLNHTITATDTNRINITRILNFGNIHIRLRNNQSKPGPLHSACIL